VYALKSNFVKIVKCSIHPPPPPLLNIGHTIFQQLVSRGGS